MPQVDTATFLPITFWTFVIYTAGFLLLNTSSLYTLLAALKTAAKRGSSTTGPALVARRSVSSSQTSTWGGLPA